ncbi:activator of stress genes 1 [Cladorrhinum sp. PSN332]|nr:activator of stress genes 1 [Cladorrhinum sp. PSN332]
METTVTNRPRRPRVLQACTRCRTGKVRCDGQTPACSPCAARNQSCVYPNSRRVRGPGKSKKRIEALEERLAAMETMLQHDGKAAMTPPADTNSDPEPIPLPASKGTAPPFDSISDRLARLEQEASVNSLGRIVFSSVVAQESEIWLLEGCIDNISSCSELPFLSTSWFLEQLKHPDALTRPGSWWQGLFNAMIANAVMLKAHNASFENIAPYAWVFCRNSFALFPELIIQGTGTNAAQAVMAMALFMRQSGDTRTTALLLSTIIRMQNVCATQESNPSPGTEEENQGRLFWGSFILDAEMALNSGLPPAHSIQVALTAPDPPTNEEQADTIFRLRAKLAEIQHRIATHLISPLTQPSDLSALEEQLNQLCLLTPPEIRPTDATPFKLTQESDVPILILHLNYFNAISMLAWASVRLLTASSAPDAQTTHHKSLARSAARSMFRTLLLFKFTLYKLPFTALWTILPYPLSASLILLAVICKEPAHPDSPGDIALLSAFLDFLNKQIGDNGCIGLQRLRDGVSKFVQVAKDAVDAALGAGSMPVNPALWPLSLAGGNTGKAISLLLTCEAYQPMYLAQSFMGNVRNRDTQNAKKVAEILGIEWEDDAQYGAFVPQSLMPATYGFVFGSPGPGKEGR